MNISIIVTEYCNLKCVNCMHRIPYLKSRMHFPESYFEWLSKSLSGIHISNLILEGGEPTLHPQFIEFSPKWREWFDCDNVILTTNGAKLKEVLNTLGYFDEIELTEYKGINDDIADWAKSQHIKGLVTGFAIPGGTQFPLDVQPYKHIENPPLCRWGNCRIIWGKKIYLCAGAEYTGHYINIGESNWMNKLDEIDRTKLCRNCFVPECWRIIKR